MTIKEAQQTIISYRNRQDNFSVGDSVFCGEVFKNSFKLHVVRILKIRKSKIGLPNCYSVKDVDTKVVFHTSKLKFFTNKKEAIEYMKAVLMLKKYCNII